MCLTIPYKIKSIKDQKAIVVSFDDKMTKSAILGLVEDIKEGDWVLMQNQIIINKISANEAKEIVDLIS